jgi:hypothetical protein
MLVLACALVIGFAAYAFGRTPAHEQRGREWPPPLQTAAVVLALPLAVVVAYVAPHLLALAALGLAVAFGLRARPARPAGRSPRRRRA